MPRVSQHTHRRHAAVSLNVDFELLPPRRARNRAVGRYLVVADVSLFYHSIYTHTIPWALHTKEIAKRQRWDMALVGNAIDAATRDSQDGQTLGVPIGPDTSLITAETLLSAVDQRLHSLLSSECPACRVLRYSDDFEISTRAASDAEVALECLQRALGDYELRLNPAKTRIVECPSHLDAPWVLDLSNYRFRKPEAIEAKDSVRYFDRAFELAKAFPGDAVLTYAVRRVRHTRVREANWSLFQNLLLHAVSLDGSLLQDVLYILRPRSSGRTPELSSLAELINFQIQRHAPLGQCSEVAWALWAAIVFKLPLEPDSAKVISRVDDSVIALLALDAAKQGLVPSGLDPTRWMPYLTTDELYGEQWLLSYQASALGLGSDSHIRADPQFKYLLDNAVAIYDTAVPLSIPRPSTQTLSGVAMV